MPSAQERATNPGSSGFALVLAIAAGATVWLTVAHESGRTEAWDSDTYWTVGYPVLAVVAALCGLLAPRRAWRWPLALMVSQFLVLFVQNMSGNLLPLGVIAFIVLAVPLLVPAYAAAFIRSRLSRRN